jgi:lysozyme family protein
MGRDMTQAPGQSGSGNGQPTFLDKIEQIAKIFATGAIPIIVGVGGWIIQTSIEHDKERAAKVQQDQQSAVDKEKISLEYVKIAKDILTSTEKDVPQELTKWSWRLLDGVSPVKFDKEDLNRLIARGERIPTPTASSSFSSLAPEYDQMFNGMRLIETPQKIDPIVDKLLEGKARYTEVEKRTGVPWFVVGLVHYEETGFNFQTHLHNNDPLTARTVNVPIGRPPQGEPPFAWEDSAADALQLGGATGVQDWSIARILYLMERHNGFGYRRSRQINSPFLWNCTSYYAKGYYVSTGQFDPEAVPQRCGAAPLLKRLIDRQLIALK